MSEESEISMEMPPGTETTDQQETVTSLEQPTPEQRALEKGWRPKEEWEGSPEDWVDAQEFNRRGELMDKISSQSKLIKKQREEMELFRQTLAELAEHNKRIAARDIEALEKELKSKRREAMESYDYDLVDELSDKLDEVKSKKKELASQEKKKEPAKKEQQVSAEMQQVAMEWAERNKWYTSDPDKATVADAFARKYMEEHGADDPRSLFSYVDKQIAKAFSNTNQPTPRSSVDAGDRTASSRKTKLSVKDLTPEERQMAQRFVDTGVMTMDEYVQQLHSVR